MSHSFVLSYAGMHNKLIIHYHYQSFKQHIKYKFTEQAAQKCHRQCTQHHQGKGNQGMAGTQPDNDNHTQNHGGKPELLAYLAGHLQLHARPSGGRIIIIIIIKKYKFHEITQPDS